MEITAQTVDPKVEKNQRAQRELVLAYKSVFATIPGRMVLEDLQRAYCWHRPTAEPGVSESEVFRRECMKHPLYHLQMMIDFDLGPEPGKKKTIKATPATPTI